MKEKRTNKEEETMRILSMYLGEDEETTKEHPQQAASSEPAANTECAPTPKRISAKMRRGTLAAYKQTFLVPSKLKERRAVYLSRETLRSARTSLSVAWAIEVPTFRALWSASCAPTWRTTPRRSRSGASCNPSTRIRRRVHARRARQACSSHLNARHAVIERTTIGPVTERDDGNARRQFVPTNCACSPGPAARGRRP